MNGYEENVRAILQCCFSQSKDEIIETAVKAIVALKQEPIVVNPTPNPINPINPVYPYNPVIYSDKTYKIDPTKITCENSTNSEN